MKKLINRESRENFITILQIIDSGAPYSVKWILWSMLNADNKYCYLANGQVADTLVNNCFRKCWSIGGKFKNCTVDANLKTSLTLTTLEATYTQGGGKFKK